MRGLTLEVRWRLGCVALIVLSASPGWTSGGADSPLVRELLAASRGQRAERIRQLAEAQLPETDLQAVFEAGEPLWPGLADALREGRPKSRARLILAASHSEAGRGSLQGALGLLSRSGRTGILAAAL